MPPDFKATSGMFWQSTLIFALLDLLLIFLLLRQINPSRFRQLHWAVAVGSALGWGTLAWITLGGFWDSYYRYFFPDSMRMFVPIFALLYALIGVVLWWLARHLAIHPVPGFCLLGACESLLEHVWGIYGAGILDRVPMLQGVSAASVLVFSFFEYILYWGIVLALAGLIASAWARVRGRGTLSDLWLHSTF